MTHLLAAVALGANVGQPQATLTAARRVLAGRLGLLGAQDLRWSALYRTAPVGPPQPDFLNAALVFKSPPPLTAPSIMELLLDVEREFGRTRLVPMGPRTLDLDLIALGAVTRRDAFLELPHPRAHGRAFVLAPLANVAPTLVLSGHGTVAGLLAGLDQRGVVKFLASDAW